MYLKSATLILADNFENFTKMCLETYKLDSANFFPAPRLAWQVSLKKTKVEPKLLTKIDMLLKVEKGIRGGI